MFCNMCGNKLTDDARFCNICGAKVITIGVQEVAEQTETQMSLEKKVVLSIGASIVGSILLLGILLFTITLITYI